MEARSRAAKTGTGVERAQGLQLPRRVWASAVSLQGRETLPAPPCHALAQETKDQLSILSSLPLGLGQKPQSPMVGAGVATPSIPVMLPLAWPCCRFGAEWRPQPHCWAGLLKVGGMVGGSHLRLPLLATQSLLPAPVHQWHDILRI